VASSAAARGLGDVPPGHLTIADDAPATIAAVAGLFADPARARAIGTKAAAWVREHWRWERMYERLDALLAEMGVTFPA
jgi:phosphatidylinositol alpha-1,6-mannosyltransferase